MKTTCTWIDCELRVWQSEKARLAIVSSSGYRLGHPRLSNLHLKCEALDGSMYSQATSSTTYVVQDVLAVELRTEKVQETKMQGSRIHSR